LPYGPYYWNSITQGKYAKTDNILANNIQQLDTTGQGMVLNYNVACGLDNWVCQRLQLFEEPYMYLLGVEFCNESMFSNRINQYTLLDRPRAQELRADFQAEYDEMMDNQLATLTIDSSYEDECFVCEQDYNYVPSLP